LTWNVERTKKEIISYYRHHKKLHKYIVNQPSIISNDVSSNKTSNVSGTPINEKVIAHYIARIKTYVIDYSDFIFDSEMLDQLLNYSDEMKTKFDLIAAMGMCELLDEDVDAIGKIPKSENIVNKGLSLWGYYYDNQGIKRYGPIPQKGGGIKDEFAHLLIKHVDDIHNVPDESEQDGLHWVSPEENEVYGKENSLLFDLI
jgi:hypothetical protein